MAKPSGVPLDLDLDVITLPLPPLGMPPPPPAAAAGSPRTMTEFRMLVEKLVAQVMPTEVDNVDELIDAYAGREAELLDTLTSMGQDSEDVGESEPSTAVDLDESIKGEGDTSKTFDDNETSAMPATPPSTLSQDELKQVYEASPDNRSVASRGSLSFLGDISMDTNDEDSSHHDKKFVAVGGATAAVGGAAAATANMTKPNEKPTVSQHFKEVAKADATTASMSLSGHSTTTRQMDNRRSTRKSLVPATLDEKDTSSKVAGSTAVNSPSRSARRSYRSNNTPQADIARRTAANSAVAVTTEAAVIPPPNDIETGGNVNDVGNVGNTRAEEKKRRRKLIMVATLVVILIMLISAGIGAALGIMFGGKNNKCEDVAESNNKDGTELEQQGNGTTPPINDTLAPNNNNDGYFTAPLFPTFSPTASPTITQEGPSPIPTFSPTAIPTFSPTTSPTIITQVSLPTCLYVNIVFDDYPSDTYWKITDLSNGYDVAKSPVYNDSLQNQPSRRRVCLADGNYAFTIADKLDDGMCCQYGQGSYNVTTDADGDDDVYVIAEGGEFGAKERTTFTMPYDPENPFVGTEPTTAKPSPSVFDSRPPVTTPAPTQLPTPQPTPLPTTNPTEQVTSPPSVYTCYNLDVSVSLDQYATDTTWEIIPQGQSAAIATSNQYDASMALGPAPLQTVCLPDGMYIFIIYDVYGDGMCCDWGQGSYQLAFGDNVVASGGEFGQSEKVTFTTPSGSVPVPPPAPTPPAECYDVFVNLILDRYPQDTSWDISKDGGVVAASQPFPADTLTDEQELCLPPGDYVFTIYDVYLDGMCCKWGDGSYSLTTNDSVVIVEGGEFGASEGTEFSLPTVAL